MDPRILWAVIRSFFEPLLTGILLRLIGVETNTEKVAQENVPFTIEYNTAQTWLRAKDPVYGFEALKNAIDLIVPPSGPTIQDVLDAIAALPAGSAIVIPPSSANAAAVWAATYQTTGLTFADLCARAGYWPWTLGGGFNWPAAGSPGFVWFGELVTPRTNPPPAVYSKQPQVDWSLWVKGGDLVTWLQANEQYFNWEADVDGSPIADTLLALGGGNTLMLRCVMPVVLLDSGAMGGAAPVWPGLPNVTPGAPVALTDALVIVGPLHGILLDLTVLPSGGTAWQVGATKVPYNWGQVGFISDNGEMEQFQWLSAEHSVYLPKQMAVAASASFRVTRPCTATVTPFTIP